MNVTMDGKHVIGNGFITKYPPITEETNITQPSGAPQPTNHDENTITYQITDNNHHEISPTSGHGLYPQDPNFESQVFEPNEWFEVEKHSETLSSNRTIEFYSTFRDEKVISNLHGLSNIIGIEYAMLTTLQKQALNILKQCHRNFNDVNRGDLAVLQRATHIFKASISTNIIDNMSEIAAFIDVLQQNLFAVSQNMNQTLRGFTRSNLSSEAQIISPSSETESGYFEEFVLDKYIESKNKRREQNRYNYQSTFYNKQIEIVLDENKIPLINLEYKLLTEVQKQAHNILKQSQSNIAKVDFEQLKVIHNVARHFEDSISTQTFNDLDQIARMINEVQGDLYGLNQDLNHTMYEINQSRLSYSAVGFYPPVDEKYGG